MPADERATLREIARQICARNPYTCIACGASLPNDDCGHKKNGVYNACLPAVDNLETDLEQALKEADRRAREDAARIAELPPIHDAILDFDTCEYIAAAIRASITTDEG